MLELKESYDELLKAFGQLELSSKDSVADMEGLLASKVEAIKVLYAPFIQNAVTEASLERFSQVVSDVVMLWSEDMFRTHFICIHE